jgi:tetratricopeptide (TPR) repeat protein
LREASTGSFEEPRRVDASVPTSLERIILEALAVAPEDRYQTAAALADDLDRWTRGEPIRARARRMQAEPSFPGVRRRILGGMAFLLAAAGVGWWVWQEQRAPSAEQKSRAETHLMYAFENYFAGDSTRALEEVGRAASLDPSSPSGGALAAHLAGGELTSAPEGARELREVLRSWARHDYRGARARLAGIEKVEPGVRALVVGLCADENGEWDEAEQQLVTASYLLPRSTFVLRRLSGVYRKQGLLQRAKTTLVRATEIDSTSTELWLDLAAVELARRDLEAGLRAVAKIRALGDSTSVALLLTEAELLSNSSHTLRARQLMETLLGRHPDHGEAWYQLGYAYDIDHEASSARDAYLRAGALTPEDPRIWLCLANIYAGASRGECKHCDAVYAAQPELYDLGEAESALLRALETDRGHREWIMRSALDISMRLERRDRVIALVDDLLGKDPSSPAGLRLAELGRRLRLTSG